MAAVRVFEAAARLGNFTRAGEELGMSQAAVSYQVRLLEDRLGVPLFRRLRGRVELTETGVRVAPLVSSAFDGLGDAFALVRSENENVLTITCSNTFATNWLAVRLGGFQIRLPNLAVRLAMDDAVVDFAHGAADVGIRNSASPWPELVSHFVMGVPIAPLASPAFLAGRSPIRTPADVIGAPRLSPEDVWWDTWLGQVGGGVTRSESRSGIRFDSQVMDGNAAIAGQGIAILNAALWVHEIRAGRLVHAIPDVAYGHSHYWLVYPEQKRNAAKVRAFRDWMLGELAREAADDRYGVYREPGPSA